MRSLCQQPSGPQGRLPVPVRADGEDAVAAIEREMPGEPGLIAAKRRPRDDVPQVTVPFRDRVGHLASFGRPVNRGLAPDAMTSLARGGRSAGFRVVHSPTKTNRLHVSVFPPPTTGEPAEWDDELQVGSTHASLKSRRTDKT